MRSSPSSTSSHSRLAALGLALALAAPVANAQTDRQSLQTRLLGDALTAIERNYNVRPNYPGLLAAAVRGLGKALPPGSFKPVKEGESLAVETNVPKTAALILMRPQNTVELRREIMEAIAFATRLQPSIEVAKLEEALLSELVVDLDPASSFLTAEEYRNASAGAGIGAELAVENGRAIVMSPVEGTAAERADLRPFDVIVRVDGTELKGRNAEEVRALFRGAPESRVQVEVLRPGEKAPRNVELVRENARAPAIRSR